MLLRFSLHREQEATAVERAVEQALAGGALTADLAPRGAKSLSTRAMGDAVLGCLALEQAATR
jgi:3-isopropylmalate dehydrogenase